MIKRNNLIAIIFIIIIVGTLVLSSHLLCQENLDDMFIFNTYGEAAPNNNLVGCKNGSKSNIYKIDRVCDISYTLSNENASLKSFIIVTIYFYSNYEESFKGFLWRNKRWRKSKRN